MRRHEVPTIPLIIRGKVITDNLLAFGQHQGGHLFYAPDIKDYLSDLVMKDPLQMQDLYQQLSLGDVIDDLVRLGKRLHLEENPHMMTACEMSQASSAKIVSPVITNGLFKALPNMLTRESIEEYVQHSVGAKYLNGWVEVPMLSGRTCNIRAFGSRTVHVIAGNSPSIALITIMNNALTRGDGIIKIPSNDPYTAAAIAHTMIDMFPDHPLTKHLSVAYWKGGDREVESHLYDTGHIDKVVAWGGGGAMRSIRDYLAPGLDLVALDPKQSASIIGPEAFKDECSMAKVARLAALDIGAFNQAGCTNARVLYVITGLDKPEVAKANVFGQMVYNEIQKLPAFLRSASPAFNSDLRAEIDGIRYNSDFKVIGGRDAEGAVIISQEDEPVDFSDQLDCRVANIVPVDSVEDALSHLTLHTQTIGIYPDSLKAEIRDQCALRGGQRIVQLGFACAGNYAGPHDAIEPMRRLLRWIRDDDQSAMTGVLWRGTL